MSYYIVKDLPGGFKAYLSRAVPLELVPDMRNAKSFKDVFTASSTLKSVQDNAGLRIVNSFSHS